MTSGRAYVGRYSTFVVNSEGGVSIKNYAGGLTVDIGYSIYNRITVGDGIDFWMGTGAFVGAVVQATILQGRNWYETKITLDAPSLTYQAWTENGLVTTAHKFTTVVPFTLAGSKLATWANGGSPLFGIDLAGLPQWSAAANAQTTVGAAGTASVLPAMPAKYLKVVDSAGTTLCVPAYLAS